MARKNMKRITLVTIKRTVDDSPETSYLGEYSAKETSTFSIDRKHALDCPQQTYNTRSAEIDQLERTISYLEKQKDAEPRISDIDADNISEAQDVLIEAQGELRDECTCGESGDMGRNEYRYFNPSFNYVDKNGKLKDGNTAEEVLKYVAQDYARMESLNGGSWCYIGISAEAKISLPSDRVPDSSIIQTIYSGGLWGIESDSDASYFEEVEKEELASLRQQLHALGFSKRAISAAFRRRTHRRLKL